MLEHGDERAPTQLCHYFHALHAIKTRKSSAAISITPNYLKTKMSLTNTQLIYWDQVRNEEVYRSTSCTPLTEFQLLLANACFSLRACSLNDFHKWPWCWCLNKKETRVPNVNLEALPQEKVLIIGHETGYS